MAVKLRLRRMGKKKRPFYRIVAADSRAARNGRFIEMVGTYDPVSDPLNVEYKEERVLHWLSTGAKPTDTVKNLLQQKGLWLKWTLIKQGADEAKISSELNLWEKAQEAKSKRLEAKKAQEKQQKAIKKAEEKVQEAEASVEVAEEATTEAAAEESKEESKEE